MLYNQDSVIVRQFKIERSDVKRKVIYHFSDVHLTEQDALSDEAERKRSDELTSAWERVRKDFALYHGESYEDFQIISAKEHLKRLVDRSMDGDALVMTGDIIDFNGGANVRAFDEIFSAFDKPFISVCGNHEDGKALPDGFLFSKTKEGTQVIEFDDLLIFGIDDSKGFITKEQNERFVELLSSGKPIIVAMHIPLLTDGNKEKLSILDEYFYLNNSKIDCETERFIKLLKENSNQLAAVFSGHLHFGNESEIESGLTQYVASQGILGNINKCIIGV